MRRMGAALALACSVITLCVPLPARGHPPKTTVAGSFHIVRFDDRITDAARTALENTGVTIIDYEPVDSYLVWGSSDELRAAEQLQQVAHVWRIGAQRRAGARLALLGPGLPYASVTVYGPELDAALESLDALGTVVTHHYARADGLLASVLLDLVVEQLGAGGRVLASWRGNVSTRVAASAAAIPTV